MIRNENEVSDEENPEDAFVQEIAEDISEEEDMDEDAHKGFLLSDKSDRNDHDSNI